ncbi:MAG: hypothetical protein E6Q83_00935 [Thiothrix sp.]|nr:MAG: hypothetical protein E6Q83_00935 [Thiothrix sp.]
MKKQAFFLQRINDHVQYLSKIKATLTRGGDFQGTHCQDCALGHWLYGKGAQEIKTLGKDAHQLFEQLIEPHEKFHEASQRALAHFQAGDELAQYRAMTDMHQLSNHLIRMLLALDRSALKHGQLA